MSDQPISLPELRADCGPSFDTHGRFRISEVLALVEAVEAAQAYYATDWNGESEDRLTDALARFSFAPLVSSREPT